MNSSIWDRAGMFLVGQLARWTFKLLSGILVGLNITAEQWEIWVAALISFLVGTLITKSQNAYLLSKEPPAK